MPNITLSGLAYTPIAFDIPNSDNREAKCVNLGPLNWTGSQAYVTNYVFDPTQSNQLLDMQNIQSIFVDNNVDGPTFITISGTNQLLRVPARSQAYLPILAGDRPIITIFSSVTAGITQVWVLNTPTTGAVWATGETT